MSSAFLLRKFVNISKQPSCSCLYEHSYPCPVMEYNRIYEELKKLCEKHDDMLQRVYIARNITNDPNDRVWSEIDRDFRDTDNFN